MFVGSKEQCSTSQVCSRDKCALKLRDGGVAGKTSSKGQKDIKRKEILVKREKNIDFYLAKVLCHLECPA